MTISVSSLSNSCLDSDLEIDPFTNGESLGNESQPTTCVDSAGIGEVGNLPTNAHKGGEGGMTFLPVRHRTRQMIGL